MNKAFSRFLIATIIVFVPLLCEGQNGVWDNPKSSSKKAAKKLETTTSRIRKLKNHIRDWGLANNYKRELLFGGRLNSNGWSGGIYFLKRNKPGNYHLWQLQFSEIRHEKQVKQVPNTKAFSTLGEPSPFFFGKVNNLYTVQLGYGREQLLLPGVVEGNVSVSFRWNAGFSLAMLKPYYLRLVKADYTQTNPRLELVEEKYSDSTAELFLKSGYTVGASKWGKGVDETRFVPGAYFDICFVITPQPKKGLVQAITLGANAAIYTKPLPVMAEVKAYRYQVCLFAGLAIGKRW